MQTSFSTQTIKENHHLLSNLKNSTPEKALKQIKEKRYASALKDYTGQKLAVGINYDSKQK